MKVAPTALPSAGIAATSAIETATMTHRWSSAQRSACS
jgi:hypothetical protein